MAQLPEPSAFALFSVLQVLDPKTDGRSVAQTAALVPALARKLGKLVGLFFVAYTKSLDIVEKMLARMIGISGDAEHDHLLHYTGAVSGATFFARSLKVLQALASSKQC